MAIILPSGFDITNVDPIDSRFTVATQDARLGFSAANVYEGLVVYQQDTNELYVLINTGSYNLSAGWQLVGKDIPTGSFATTGSNRFNGNQIITGSVTSTLGFTGSLQGTSSFAINALTASYVNPLRQTVIITGSLQLSSSAGTLNNIGGTTYLGSILGIGVPADDSFYPLDRHFIRASVRTDVPYTYGFLQSYSEPGSGFQPLRIEASQIIFVSNVNGSTNYFDNSGSLGLTNISWLGGTPASSSYPILPSKLYIKGNGSGSATTALLVQNSNLSSSLVVLDNGNTIISGSLSQGLDTLTSGNYSHAEGDTTTAQGNYSHAEGASTTAQGDYSHVEGALTISNGYASHAEGYITTAQGDYSHAEGSNTQANGNASHTEGQDTIANGVASHAEGYTTTAQGDYSHAEGIGTIASGSGQTVIGKYNVRNNISSLFIIGNGTDNSNRSNIVLVNNNNVVISGSLFVTGSNSFNGNQAITGSLNILDGIIRITSSSNSGSEVLLDGERLIIEDPLTPQLNPTIVSAASIETPIISSPVFQTQSGSFVTLPAAIAPTPSSSTIQAEILLFEFDTTKYFGVIADVFIKNNSSEVFSILTAYVVGYYEVIPGEPGTLQSTFTLTDNVVFPDNNTEIRNNIEIGPASSIYQPPNSPIMYIVAKNNNTGSSYTVDTIIRGFTK
jgi:hypothetical protein